MKKIYALLFFLILTSCHENQKPILSIFTWNEMLDSDLVHEFEEQFHCRVIIDLYDSNESMYAKMKLGESSYDILFPSNYYLKIMENQGMVQKLDFSLIPNHKYLDSEYFNVNESAYGVPFMISYSGIGINVEKLEMDIPSYTIFSSQLYYGRMTMFDDAREALGASLKTLGYSINSREKSEVEAAADLLIQWKMNLAKFENEQYKNGLINGEFLISQSYSNDILRLQSETTIINFKFPIEGAILAIEHITIPISAPNKNLAHAFINFMLSPTIAARNIQYTHALIPVKASYPLLPDQFKNNPVLFPSKKEKMKIEKIQDLGEDVRLYYQAWERVKGS